MTKRPLSTSVGKAEKDDKAGSKPPEPLAVVVAPAPKRTARGRSSSATPPAVPTNPTARSRSKDKATTSSAAAAEQPADTPVPKRLAKEPDDPYKTRANLEYIAANLVEAVKIDGFNAQDADRALTLYKAAKGANEKELKAIEKEMGTIWKANGEALASYNARLRADKKAQEKENKKQKKA
jgi:hypothetical protein